MYKPEFHYTKFNFFLFKFCARMMKLKFCWVCVHEIINATLYWNDKYHLQPFETHSPAPLNSFSCAVLSEILYTLRHFSVKQATMVYFVYILRKLVSTQQHFGKNSVTFENKLAFITVMLELWSTTYGVSAWYTRLWSRFITHWTSTNKQCS